MKRIKRWLVLALTAVMVLGCTVPAFAAEGESPVRLSVPETVPADSTVAVALQAAEADTVADGKLVISYDAEKLTYVDVQVGTAWSDPAKVVLSVNSDTAGKVILAFAAPTAAGADTLFNLHFAAAAVGNATLAITDGYVSGTEEKPADEVKTELLTPVGHAVVFQAGSHGVFADGKTTLLVEVPDGKQLLDKVPEVIPYGGFTLSGWRDEEGKVYRADAISKLKVIKAMTLTAVYSGECDGGKDCPTAKYTDLSYTGETHAAIDFVVENAYMIGVSDSEFAPELEMTRGMLVTVLYRMSGSPAQSAKCRFTDVAKGAWYYDAVVWATENEITYGMGGDVFAPDAKLTREQLVTFLYRYAKLTGEAGKADGSLRGFTDASQIQSYAIEAFRWAIANDVIKGTGADTLSPQGTATREQFALVLYRLLRGND